jgi:hypothetical protein
LDKNQLLAGNAEDRSNYFTNTVLGGLAERGTLSTDLNYAADDARKELAELITSLYGASTIGAAYTGLGDAGKPDKDYKAEIERYHEITRQIEDQEQALDKLADAKDNAYGNSKIALMDQEIAGMEKLKEQ